MEEAVEWLKQCPNPHNTESDVEIRPVFELEDFGDAITSERLERKARLRAAYEGKK
jgi:hypothetical protein